MALFAPLEDALAYGALGNLPGAPTADLTVSPPTSIVAAPSVRAAALQHRPPAGPDLMTEIDQREFDEMIATKKESAFAPDGIPYSIFRWLGSHFLFNA